MSLFSSQLAGLSPDDLQRILETNLALWADAMNLKVDNRPFDFVRRRYLVEPYSTSAKKVVIRKAAQTGFTIYMILYSLHMCIARWRHIGNGYPVKVGYYFPGKDEAGHLMKDRFEPIIRGNPLIHAAIDRSFSDSVSLKKVGESSLYLLHIGGHSAKDSVPLDAVCFDEVRLMKPRDINQAEERVSGSDLGWYRYVSTAGLPGDGIDTRYLASTQHTYLSKCSCSDGGIDLAEVWPDCVSTYKGEVVYICPKCQTIIRDPQNGCWVAKHPSREILGYGAHQLLSPTTTPTGILEKFQTTDNLKEFYNAVLGRPFVSPRDRPITEADLWASVRESLRWNEGSQDRARRAIGVDQKATRFHVIITDTRRDGKRQLVHAELIDEGAPQYRDLDPKDGGVFLRLGQLIHEWEPDIMIIDAAPNTHETLKLAQTFPGRVYLAEYQTLGKDLVRWYDRNDHGKKRRHLRTKSEMAMTIPWIVGINKYRAFSVLFGSILDGTWELPNPKTLVQEVRDEYGRYSPSRIVEEHVFKEMQNLVRATLKTTRKDKDGEIVDDNEEEYTWARTGPDDFAHAWLYANIGLHRYERKFGFAFL